MRKTKTNLRAVKIGEHRFYCVTWPKLGKGRNRRFFKRKPEADTFLETKQIEQRNYGTAAMAFTESQRAEYTECCEKLEPFNVTLRDAVSFYLPHLRATNRSCTVAQLVDEVLKVKKADGASVRYLGDLRSRLRQFSRSFNGNVVAEITATDIDQWLRNLLDLRGQSLAPTTRNNFRRVLIVAFNLARGRGYCVDNPAKKTAKAKQVEGTVGILTPEQTAALLENSPKELVPFLALAAFAGLRRAELERLDWREIDTESELIEVTATKAKSARRRFVKIRPNLSAWLKPHVQLSGRVTPLRYRGLLDSARNSAKLEAWPQNALRHSFASYHLARFNDAAALALEMGHTNSNLVFQHYRQIVKPKHAVDYWKIAPPKAKRLKAEDRKKRKPNAAPGMPTF